MEVWTYGAEDKPEAICRTNFFEVGGIKSAGIWNSWIEYLKDLSAFDV